MLLFYIFFSHFLQPVFSDCFLTPQPLHATHTKFTLCIDPFEPHNGDPPWKWRYTLNKGDSVNHPRQHYALCSFNCRGSIADIAWSQTGRPLHRWLKSSDCSIPLLSTTATVPLSPNRPIRMQLPHNWQSSRRKLDAIRHRCTTARENRRKMVCMRPPSKSYAQLANMAAKKLYLNRFYWVVSGSHCELSSYLIWF